jgi:aminoglycoside phosphotransferase (APT) family kinase protein
VFLHRDYHPGNVLWSGGEISGIVDWVSGCIGPPEVDVAHCRANLAVLAGDPEAADRFLELWQSVTGCRDYHPYWDLTTVVSVVSEEPDPALDAFVATAAARLGD